MDEAKVKSELSASIEKDARAMAHTLTCAPILDESGFKTYRSVNLTYHELVSALQTFAILQRAQEREACAKIADDEDEDIAYSGQNNNWKARKSALKEVAAAIRARP